MLKASLPKSVNVETHVDEQDMTIVGSAGHMSQALMNLCINAKDAMDDERGTLNLSLKRANSARYDFMDDWQDDLPKPGDMPPVQIEDIDEGHVRMAVGSLARGHDYICLQVADTGCGMRREVMEHIFEPFFTTKTLDKGTGLGLAMVHGVVSSHRGALIIDSVVGKGTQFILLLPSIESVAKNEIIQKNEKPDMTRGQGRILLVEDQETVRLMMVKMLERKGYEVESCDQGTTALDIIGEHPDYFDVVLTDQNMPEMTGVELAQAVAPGNPELSFILITGYREEKLRTAIENQKNIKALLRKPVEREVLFQTLKTVIEKKDVS